MQQLDDYIKQSILRNMLNDIHNDLDSSFCIMFTNQGERNNFQILQEIWASPLHSVFYGLFPIRSCMDFLLLSNMMNLHILYMFFISHTDILLTISNLSS